MIKKILFLLSFILTICFFTIPANAATMSHYGYNIVYNSNTDKYDLHLIYYNFLSWESSTVTNTRLDNSFCSGAQVFAGTYNSFQDADDAVTDYIYNHPVEDLTLPDSYFVNAYLQSGSQYTNYVFNIPYRYVSSDTDIVTPSNPDYPDPEPGPDWLSDMWEWFLWQLGINDDYSGDIDAYITGGDRERMQMVTPSPTPSPTPVPSPTPYSLDIVDNNGNPVYTITGIPGSTYNITNTTNNNDGSDFDIFEVDLQIGDGGSTNPRDGLNDVMDTSLTYLSDPENVDMQPVGDSFSIIPSDWFLLLGVVACFPFIAGFISKLLK